MEQPELIDRTPLGLWAESQAAEPVPEAPTVALGVAQTWTAKPCLCCRKRPAAPDSCCCSEACKTKLKSSLVAWGNRLKPVEEGAQSLL